LLPQWNNGKQNSNLEAHTVDAHKAAMLAVPSPNNETVAALSNDILQNWNTTYSLEHFGPCKNFDGPVDKDSNRQLPNTRFHETPLLNQLVDTFTEMLQYLTIDMVWIIVKSYDVGSQQWQWWGQATAAKKDAVMETHINQPTDGSDSCKNGIRGSGSGNGGVCGSSSVNGIKPGTGFQSWHQDFNLNEKITKTIVINLGAVKRSDLLGGPLCELINSENEDNEGKVSGSDTIGGQMSGFINSDNEDNKGKVSVMKGIETEQPDDAMAKRNRKQESQAIKAMKQCGRAAQAAGAGIGAVVTLKVNFRKHSHDTQGLIAIVYEMKESTGGILVCREHGVITHDGSRKDYWVPYDKYTGNARAQDTCPIEDALQSVRNLVLESRYVSTDQRRISYSKYHEIEIGTSSPIKKGKGCSCKKGCGKNCGCKKKGFRCHSGCFCNRNCCVKGV